MSTPDESKCATRLPCKRLGETGESMHHNLALALKIKDDDATGWLSCDVGELGGSKKPRVGTKRDRLREQAGHGAEGGSANLQLRKLRTSHANLIKVPLNRFVATVG